MQSRVRLVDTVGGRSNDYEVTVLGKQGTLAIQLECVLETIMCRKIESSDTCSLPMVHRGITCSRVKKE